MADDSNTSLKSKTAEPEEPKEADEEVGKNTKIKVIVAFLVVGFAAAIALWIQQPGDVKNDVFNNDLVAQNTESNETISFTQEVSIIDFAYTPTLVTIKKGTKVNWTNKDSVPHTITGENFSSKTLNPGDTFSYTFNENGSFEYICTFHPQMKGTVTVEDPNQLEEATITTPVEEGSTLTPESSPPPASAEEGSPEFSIPASNDQTTVVNLNTEDLLNDKALEQILNATSPIVDGNTLSASALEVSDEQAITNSGPEHIVYLLIGLLILHRILNKRKHDLT